VTHHLLDGAFDESVVQFDSSRLVPTRPLLVDFALAGGLCSIQPDTRTQVVMCGEVVDCQRAVEWGVVQYAPDGDVMQFTLDMAAKWAQKPELASHLAKKVIDFGNSDKALLVERIAEAVLYQVTRRRPPCCLSPYPARSIELQLRASSSRGNTSSASSVGKRSVATSSPVCVWYSM
jgi:hypothetical protein